MGDQQYCEPCRKRGHQCLTNNLVDGVPTCVFCEDNEPCPQDKVKAAIDSGARLQCSHPDCKGTYRKGGKHPFCSECQHKNYHVSKTHKASANSNKAEQHGKSAATKKPAAKTAPTVRTKEIPVVAAEVTVDIAAIRVPVQFLDDFWQQRSAEEKAAMVSFHFAQEAGIATHA
jgi:hypothetical protein